MDFIRAIYVSVFTVSMLFSAVYTQGYAKGFEPSQKSILFREIIKQFEKEMQRDLDLIPTGSGGRVHDKIEEFEMFFCSTKNASIEEARLLEVQACKRLLDIINNYPDAKLWLDHYPFLKNDITVYIRLNDQPGELHNYQTVGNRLAAVSLINGNVLYQKCHPKKACYITALKESFEEAAKIVHQADANP